MFKKICNRCNRPSFSSSYKDKWFCPTCKEDLTNQAKLPTQPIRPTLQIEMVYGPIYQLKKKKA